MQNDKWETAEKSAEQEAGITDLLAGSPPPPVDRSIDERTLQRIITQTADSGGKLEGEFILNADINKTGLRGGVTDSEVMHGKP